ncbi:anti-sigma factor [Bacillus sp. DTU_2020_1000418_1_SI_GHA_SEK_038]|uniref:anti-sigma factor n=1 Tax=Bacillus sp. DTU_2020_1000418_1_SI_GHA_SEK_038 TaxID=3077585 RepID=UPI0028E40DCD|nr:anti-sigma factor [Bacillus sp. DTU_2020_1000418_1_SI_GHA_SEK_038]WNS76285.1 anti-sigma factor [Bacillus sp. DTU_2020_1000418_1_SI_GHA_SEK_038]
MEKNKCENLSLFITDQLSGYEQEQFEKHLNTCAHCRNEVNSFQETWQMLSYDIEETEVPDSLKDEVMNFIFVENNMQTQVNKKQSFFEQLKGMLAKHFSPLSAGIMTVLAIGLIGLLWNNLQLKESITALENKALSPAQIVRTIDLKGQDLAASASGIAYLLQEGQNTNLIIELNNMPMTENDEVYQVWLLKNGNRHNAGILKPDQNGNGLITYQLPKDHTFDDIGITLEPNTGNTQPKGQKVMGTL